ncbi:MAG TPA: hypothetical protein VIQ99_06735 [Gammaproteobacteria bacterium]
MDLIHEVEKVEGAVVDVELGVVEGHAGEIDDADTKVRRPIDRDRAV